MSGLEQGWGLQVVLWFQSWRTALIGGAGVFFAFLGSEDFWLPFLAMTYWCVDAAFGRRLAILYIAQSWVNTMLKEVFQRPRPFNVSSEVRPLVPEDTPGLPSGHMQTATVIGGILALKLKRGWVTALAILFMVLMGISRMVVGVHYPQDVAAGLVFGLIVAGLYVWLEPLVSVWLNRQGLWTQIGVALAAGLAMLAIHPLLIPAIYPDDLSYALSSGGALIGSGIGFALEARYVRFHDGGVWWKVLLRLLLGMAILLAVRFGLSAVFASLQPVWLFRVIRYTCIGLSVGWLAPWLFVKLSLADRRIG